MLAGYVQVFEQICQAVGFAHARGVIHRDLKPANVMVGEFAEVQVMDWGLAKLLGDGGPSRESPAAISSEQAAASLGRAASALETVSWRPDQTPSGEALTQSGAILGTPSYMAPEQARGEAVDARADVFSLGRILATILVNAPAYSGTTTGEILSQAVRGDARHTLARVQACGADAELISITTACLAPAAGVIEGATAAAQRRRRWIEVFGVDRIPNPFDNSLGSVHARWIRRRCMPVNRDLFGLGQNHELQTHELLRREGAGQLGVEEQLLGAVLDLVGRIAAAAGFPVADHQLIRLLHDQIHSAEQVGEARNDCAPERLLDGQDASSGLGSGAEGKRLQHACGEFIEGRRVLVLGKADRPYVILPTPLVLGQQLLGTRRGLPFEQPAKVVLDRPVD